MNCRSVKQTRQFRGQTAVSVLLSVVVPGDLDAATGRTIDSEHADHLKAVLAIIGDLLRGVAGDALDDFACSGVPHSSCNARVFLGDRRAGGGFIWCGLSVQSERQHLRTRHLHDADTVFKQRFNHPGHCAGAVRTPVELGILVENTVRENHHTPATAIAEWDSTRRGGEGHDGG